MLRLGQMQGAHFDRERLVTFVMGNAQAVSVHLVDMCRPHIDEGHVLAGAGHMRPGVAADRTHSDDADPLAHAFLPPVPG